MPGQTILQHNTAFINTAMNLWCAVIEKTLMPIDPPKTWRISSKRHGPSEQYASEYWKARRRVERVINAVRIDSNGEDRRFVKAIARQHIFNHMSCSVYFGDGGKLGGASFVHLLKSRDGTFKTPQATFVGETSARMAAASILFFCYNGQSIPEALLIYADKTIDRGPFGISYRGLTSFSPYPHHAWEEQGCTREEMSELPTRAQKNSLRDWFNQRRFEVSRRRIASAQRSSAYKRIIEAVESHEQWSSTAFSDLNRVQLEYVYRPWRVPNVLFNGAASCALPYLAYPLSSDRMAVGIPEGVNLKINGVPKQGVQLIKPSTILESGVQQIWFVDGKLTTPAVN